MKWINKKCNIEDLKPAEKMKICELCKSYFVAKKDHKNYSQTYCSIFCKNEALRKGKQNKKVCKQCSNVFIISPSEIGSKFFCSKKCYTQWQKKQVERVRVVCDNCGKKTVKIKSFIRQYNYRHHFCSHFCLFRYNSKRYLEWSNIKRQWGSSNPAWNKDLKLSDEHKKNLSISHKKPRLKKIYVKNFGIYAIKGNNYPVWNRDLSGYKTKPHYRHRGHIPWNKGTTGFMAGDKHYNWKGGISFEPYPIDWTESLRISIRERDKYICQVCSQYGNA